MMERSKSAKTESMPNIALPLGEVVSMPWVLRNRSTLSALSSSRKLTRSFRLRPSLSTDQGEQRCQSVCPAEQNMFKILKRTQGGRGDPAGERGGGRGLRPYCPFNTSPFCNDSEMGP